MIVALAVVGGFREVIVEKLYSFNGHVHVSYFDNTNSQANTNPPILYDRKLETSISALPHVVSVTPFAQRPVIVLSNGAMEGIRMKGVNSTYQLPPAVTLKGKPIDYSDTTYSRQILLSGITAARLDTRPGDTVQLEFLENGTMPRIRRVRVAGIFHSGFDEIDKYYALCDIRLLQRINNWSADSINAYQIDLDDAKYADTVTNFIHYNLVTPPIYANTVASNFPGIFYWLDIQNTNSTILLIIMAIVAVINMAAVLFILMVDRAAMIGLLKALGMPAGSLVRLFLSIAGIIGFSGILLGNVIALTLCWLQSRFGIITLPEETYYMKYAPIKLVWWQVVVTDAATLALCVFCMWLPALYIRTIQPAKALQFK